MGLLFDFLGYFVVGGLVLYALGLRPDAFGGWTWIVAIAIGFALTFPPMWVWRHRKPRPMEGDTGRG